MPLITITFDYPHAPLPKYKFGDRVAQSDECPPRNWLIGKVVGLTIDESYAPTWYYSIKLDAPSGLTEEYLGDDLVPETEIPNLQAKVGTTRGGLGSRKSSDCLGATTSTKISNRNAGQIH